MTWLRTLLGRTVLSGATLSIGDQAAVSAGNFGTGVVLARTFDQATFAVFVLATSALYFVLQVQYGVLLSPLTVNGAALDDQAFGSFIKANLWLQLAFALLACALLAVVVELWEPLRSVGLPLLTLAAAWQSQEFCRRVLYARGLMGSALLNNVINYDLQVVCFLMAIAWSNLTLSGALWVAASTSLISTALGVWQIRRFLAPSTASVTNVLRDNLHIGKWTAAGSVVLALGQQSTPLLVAAIDGTPSAAVLGVVYQLVGPINLLGRPLQNYHLPLAVRSLATEGTPGLNRTLRRAMLITAPGYVAYTLALAVAPEFFLTAVYGSKYVEYANILRVLALINLTVFGILVLQVELGARRLQKQVFIGIVINTAFLYVLGVYLTTYFGPIGLVSALGAATLVQFFFYFATALRARARPQRGGSGSPTPR